MRRRAVRSADLPDRLFRFRAEEWMRPEWADDPSSGLAPYWAWCAWTDARYEWAALHGAGPERLPRAGGGIRAA